jgi:hypothetical protein
MLPVTGRYNSHATAEDWAQVTTFRVGNAVIGHVSPISDHVRGEPLSERAVFRGRFAVQDTLGFTHSFPCIVKVAKRSVSAPANLTDWSELQNEARVLSELTNSPEESLCPRCYFVDVHLRCLVLETCGIDLQTLLIWGSAKWHIASHIAGLVSAVEWLHTRADVLVHGNLRPENVFCRAASSTDVTVWLGDFSQTCTVGTASPAHLAQDSAFSPPEKLRLPSEKLPTASLEMDIFSLGLVVWQLLHNTARPVLKSEDPSVVTKLRADQDALNKALAWPTSWDYMHQIVALDPSKRMDISKLKLRLCRSLLDDAFITEFTACINRSLTRHAETVTPSTRSSVSRPPRATEDVRSNPLGMVPLLVAINPCKADGATERRDLPQFLHFCCPVCGTLAKSGRGKLGYKLRSTRDCLLKVPAALKVTSFVLWIVSQLSPLPLPHHLIDFSAFVTLEECQKITKAVDHARQAQGTVGAAVIIKELLSEIKKVLKPELVNALTVTKEHVSIVKHLLQEAGESVPPYYSGLYRVICEATKECGWVCRDCVEKYAQEGNTCLAVWIDRGSSAPKVESLSNLEFDASAPVRATTASHLNLKPGASIPAAAQAASRSNRKSASAIRAAAPRSNLKSASSVPVAASASSRTGPRRRKQLNILDAGVEVGLIPQS